MYQDWKCWVYLRSPNSFIAEVRFKAGSFRFTANVLNSYITIAIIVKKNNKIWLPRDSWWVILMMTGNFGKSDFATTIQLDKGKLNINRIFLPWQYVGMAWFRNRGGKENDSLFFGILYLLYSTEHCLPLPFWIVERSFSLCLQWTFRWHELLQSTEGLLGPSVRSSPACPDTIFFSCSAIQRVFHVDQATGI